MAAFVTIRGSLFLLLCLIVAQASTETEQRQSRGSFVFPNDGRSAGGVADLVRGQLRTSQAILGELSTHDDPPISGQVRTMNFELAILLGLALLDCETARRRRTLRRLRRGVLRRRLARRMRGQPGRSCLEPAGSNSRLQVQKEKTISHIPRPYDRKQ